MKTLHKIFLSCLLLVLCSCNKSDDESGGSIEPTTAELLTSGTWYFESKIPGTYTACEKMGYIKFMDNGELILNSFDDGSGTCESLGEVRASYTLTNTMNLTIVFGADSQSAVIDAISEDELRITNADTGEKIVFDKTEG